MKELDLILIKRDFDNKDVRADIFKYWDRPSRKTLRCYFLRHDKEHIVEDNIVNGLKITGNYNEKLKKIFYNIITKQLTKSYFFKVKDFDYDEFEQLKKELNKNIKEFEQELKEIKNRKKELKDLSENFSIKSCVIQDSIENIDLNINKEDSIQDKYIKLTGSLNDTIDFINKNNSLEDQKELAEAFVRARHNLNSYVNSKPGKIFSFVDKMTSKQKWLNKSVKSIKSTYYEVSSNKDNIDNLFGLIHEKYNKLIETAEALQKSKATILKQINELENLMTESDLSISKYSDYSEIPVRELSLNTQIKASVEKYKTKFKSVTSAIQAMQGTIVSLGRDLPSHKSDLEDELAISSLLNNVDDYQNMINEIKILVNNVTTTTREKTYKVVENLMDMQIEDTHTMTAIAQNVEKGTKLAKMVAVKSKQLSKKTQEDAKFLSEVIAGTPIAEIRKKLK